MYMSVSLLAPLLLQCNHRAGHAPAVSHWRLSLAPGQGSAYLLPIGCMTFSFTSCFHLSTTAACPPHCPRRRGKCSAWRVQHPREYELCVGRVQGACCLNSFAGENNSKRRLWMKVTFKCLNRYINNTSGVPVGN